MRDKQGRVRGTQQRVARSERSSRKEEVREIVYRE